eukprot:1162736_1
MRLVEDILRGKWVTIYHLLNWELGLHRYRLKRDNLMYVLCQILVVLSAGEKNGFGQLGYQHTSNLGDETHEMGDFLSLVDLGSDLIATQITTGRDHVCALFTSGNIKCWGLCSYGQLGYGNTNNLGDKPGEMGDNLPFVNLGLDYVGAAVEVKAGGYHTCAVLSSAELKCWGRNDYSQLGIIAYDRYDSTRYDPDNLPTVDLGFPSMYPTSSPSRYPTDIPTSQANNPSSSPTKIPTTSTYCKDNGLIEHLDWNDINRTLPKYTLNMIVDAADPILTVELITDYIGY